METNSNSPQNVQTPAQLQNLFNKFKKRNNNTPGAFGGKRKHNGAAGFKRPKSK